jgi:dihydrolipoamide dehydrogenase
MPKSLLVIGSGAIGIEFANFYHALGAQVTVVEVMDQIMPVEDSEIAQIAQKAMQKRGMKFRTGCKVTNLDRQAEQVIATLDKDGQSETLSVDTVITATGVRPNVENLNLEQVGVDLTGQGFIKVDEYCQTSIKGIYAIGDVVGAPCLAHKASHEGIMCVEKIVGHGDVQSMDKSMIPGCTYCFPQVASVGLTEQQAMARGLDIKVGRFPFQANGKAIAMGDTEGVVKVIFDQNSGELLGAHMVGSEVTELIQGFVVAKTMETTEEELMHTIFPHPTLSEMMHESVLDAYAKAVHI